MNLLIEKPVWRRIAQAAAMSGCTCVAACGHPDSSSLAAKDPPVEILPIDDLARANACPDLALIFMVGVGEEPGTVTAWHAPDTPPPAATTGGRSLNDAVIQAESELGFALSRDPGCANRRTKVIFARLMDGPLAGDSAIRATVYGYGPDTGSAWRVLKEQSYAMTSPAAWEIPAVSPVAAASANHVMELNTPAVVSVVAAAFATPKVLEGLLPAGATPAPVAPDLVIHILKTHGARLATQASARPDGRAFPVISGTDSGATAPLLFLDTHGPGIAPDQGDLYVPLWTPAALAAAPDASGTPGEPGNPIAGIRGNPTAGLPGNPTATVGMEGMAGKGLVFARQLADPTAPDLALPPQGLLTLGAAATYGPLTSVTGRLPTLTLPAGTGAPTLVILDSCFGARSILNALPPGRGAVALANPDPLFYDFLNYSALTTAGYLGLPALLHRLGLTPDARLTGPERALVRDLAAGTFDSGKISPGQEAAFKRLTIWSAP